MSVKITSLEVENVKRVKAVRLEPSLNGLTVIGGKNGQGKTSVLDAIAWALGGEKFRPSSAEREGSVIPPHLHLELSNGIIVERKGKNSALTVIDPSGKKAGQQLLNEFISAFALDLPKFLDAGNKEKAEILLRIIGVGDQLKELEQQETQLYYSRRSVNQELDRKRKYASELPFYQDAPPEMVSVSELIKRQQEILARNGENQRKRQQAENLNRQKELLYRQLSELQQRYDAVCQDCETAARSVQDLIDESTAQLETDIAGIELLNQKVRANLAREHAEEEAQEYARQSDALTLQLEKVRQLKNDLLQSAPLPLPELLVEDGELVYKGRKWDCMSGAEQLMVGTAIVRKLNPNCGFVLLDKLEQMDADTMRTFGEWLQSVGLQAIATRVSTGGECSIVIEDGFIRGETGILYAPETDGIIKELSGEAKDVAAKSWNW